MKKLSWHRKIPFFRNSFLLRTVFMAYLAVILFVSLIITAIFVLDGDGDQLVQIIPPLLAVYFFIFVLLWVSTWIAVGNKYALKYTLHTKGITISGTRDKAKNIRKLAIAAGVLTANPRLLGAGLLVRDDIIQLAWKDIQEIRWKPLEKKLLVKCTLLHQGILHYPPAMEEEIIAFIRKYSTTLRGPIKF